jgi:hypothetical protein
MPTKKTMLEAALGVLGFTFGLTPLTIAAPALTHAKDLKLDSTKQELVLNQVQRDSGSYITTVTRHAVKMVNSNNGIVLVAKAPRWEVYFFRPSDKIIWIGPMDKLSPATIFNPFKDHTTMEVRPATLAASHLDHSNSTKGQVIYKDGEGSLQGIHYIKYSNFGVGSKTVFFAADQFPIDPTCAEVLSRMCRNPLVNQVPLYVLGSKPGKKAQSEIDESKRKSPDFPMSDLYNMRYDVRTGPQEYLVTNSWKVAPFNNSDFAAPTNYKRVAKFTDVYFSKKIRSQITTVIDDMGFVSPEKDDKHNANSNNTHSAP